MFIERLKRLNPSLVAAAMQSHQGGELQANTYLLDTATIEDLGRIADRVVVRAHGAISEVLDRAAGDVLSEATLLAAIHQESEAVA